MMPSPLARETLMDKKFPSMQEVEKADREQIATWHISLPTSKVASQQEIKDRIGDRFYNMGGMTPGLSKKLESRQRPVSV